VVRRRCRLGHSLGVGKRVDQIRLREDADAVAIVVGDRQVADVVGPHSVGGRDQRFVGGDRFDRRGHVRRDGDLVDGFGFDVDDAAARAAADAELCGYGFEE
jgi:hypothetical protein